jgi:hypothetical protein
VVFEPWLSLLIDAGNRALFTGVYHRSFEDNDDADAVPDLCWRRSEWLRDVDTTQIGDATDRQAYLAGDTQIASTIGFARQDHQPAVTGLIHRSVDQFAHGITIAAARRPDATWHWLQVTVADDNLNTHVEYSPLLGQSPLIEAWIPEWLAGLDSLDPTHTTQPDTEITISYRRSLPELLTAVPPPLT